MSSLEQPLRHWPLAWSLARSAHFTLQHRTLPLLEFALTGKRRSLPPDPKAFVKYATKELYQLLKQDSQNIAQGLYPASVLKPEGPVQHWKRTLSIIWDGIFLAQRRKQGAHKELPEEIKNLSTEFPEYYLRNFHYQTDGYFSDHSADIYEHQVEILFAGAADPMRRLILPLAKQKWQGDGQGLHFLELASGTGRLSKFMKLAYPKAKITLLEPSEAYLKKSREQLKDFTGVYFHQGFGENLPFKDESFDMVYSCFLFHELPLVVRKKILAESRRVLKPEGSVGLVDSLQLGDKPPLDWSLEQFPRDFHEPFYTDYIKTPLSVLLRDAGFAHNTLKEQQGFYSKALMVDKQDA